MLKLKLYRYDFVLAILKKKWVYQIPNGIINTLSWNAVSSEALASTTPLNPPIVNINTKPKANNNDGIKFKEPP